MSLRAKTDEKYWSQYDGLQNAKHSILRKYLDGWFPILSKWNGRVLYIDCHAGRGRHKTGHEGSPILALNRLLQHTFRNKILNNTKVNFIFFEINPRNFTTLENEIQKLGNLPGQVENRIFCENYEIVLKSILHELKRQRQSLAPTFAFLDPYGFNLSMDLLNTILAFPKSELFINFMCRYIDLALFVDEQAPNLNNLFGCNDWDKLKAEDNPKKRYRSTVQLFSKQLNAKWLTQMNMEGPNKLPKYVLLHATNNRRGRELMKEAMWSVAPDGSFTAHERDNPEQLILLIPEPNLESLKSQLWNEFAGRVVYLEDLYEWLLDQLYLKKHLHAVLREYRNHKPSILEFSDYGQRFSFQANPIVHFPKKRPEMS